jgi:exodeoxyribonuclease-3
MFRLLTYNIRDGGRGRARAIARVIASCEPDLVLLQEATDRATVEEIADAAGMADARTSPRQSLGFLSRAPVLHAEWTRPRISRHAFIEVVPRGGALRIFGVHLSALHAAWTERRRVMELRALLASVRRHEPGFHALAGDFNTVAPGEPLEIRRLPPRLRPLVWLSGGRIRWRTVQTILNAGYVDAFRLTHPRDAGATLPTSGAHVRLDYVFVPEPFAPRVHACRVVHHPDARVASDHFPVLAELETATTGM